MTIYLKVQKQLEYLKFKSAQHYLEHLYHDHQLTEAELSGLYKILAKEVETKEVCIMLKSLLSLT
ncbi:hypothetical protein [Globicatella sanguinis]